jgi:membrane associated rhomboid family serine protease
LQSGERDPGLACRAVIPLKDYNPTTTRAYVTIMLIVVCAVVYFFVQPSGQDLFKRNVSGTEEQLRDTEFTFAHAAIPCEVTQGHPITNQELESGQCLTHGSTQDEFFPSKNVYLAILYSMFLHGSILHIAGNMLFLWIFGNNIEDRMGHWKYLLFYLVAGVLATATYILFQPHSLVPVLGASGAIAGVMGVYLILFPNVRIRTLIFVFLTDISAKWLLVFWFVSQFFVSPGSGVAWVAHVGGFVFGAFVGLAWRGLRGGSPPPPRVVSPLPPYAY